MFGSADELCRWALRDGFNVLQRPRKAQNLPYASLGPLFAGREEVLADLHARFSKVPTRVIVLHGLGGVGKTRLAVEYAHRHSAEYSAELVIRADVSQALSADLAALCGEKVLDLPEREAKEQSVQVEAALRWLSEHPGWLVVIDNVDSREAVDTVEEILPRLSAGHVLVTSRVTDWSGSVDPVDLRELDREDAAAFVLARTRSRRVERESDSRDALELASELGSFPLALEQAGAFIAQKRTSIAEYLARWRTKESKVRQWADERVTRYPRSVVVTWDTTFEQLDASAQALLRVIAWLAPDPFPREMLQTEKARHAVAQGVERMRGSVSGVPDVEDAVATLAAFSLLRGEAGASFSVHALVQEVTRDRLADEERAFWLAWGLSVASAFMPIEPPPDDVRSWPVWEAMRRHVETLITIAEREGIAKPTARLMNELGIFLEAKGEWNDAEPIMRRALAIEENSSGSDDPRVATCLGNLAHLLKVTNRPAQAEPLMRRALAIDEKTYGPEHPYAARSLNNLAMLLKVTNRVADAEPLMRRALAINEKSYGPEHPSVAILLNNLASVLHDTTRFAEAEILMRRALAIDEKSYGREHPEVATVLNNLAQLLKETNRLADAEPLSRRGLEILLQTSAASGHSHPHLSTARANYAQLLVAMGLPEEQVSARIDEILHQFHLEKGSICHPSAGPRPRGLDGVVSELVQPIGSSFRIRGWRAPNRTYRPSTSNSLSEP